MMNIKKLLLGFLLVILSSQFLAVQSQDNATNLIEEADSLWENKDYVIALKKYEKALQNASDSNKQNAIASLNDAYLSYTKLLMENEGPTMSKVKKDYIGASIYYKKYLNQIFPDKDSKAHQDSLMRFQLILANQYFASEQYQQAGRIYKTSLKKLIKAKEAGNVSEIALKLAQCYVGLKNYVQAGKMYAKGYGSINLDDKAEELYCQGYYLQAARLLSYLVNKKNDEQKNLYMRLIARAYFKSGDDDNARYWYKKCLADDELLNENVVINFNQNCESCEQLLKNKGYFFSSLKEPGQLDIDRFYFAQVQLNLSGKLIEASELINNATIIYHTCEDKQNPCINFEKTFHISKLTSEGINTNESSEYSPVYFENDTLIFASDRNPLNEKMIQVNGEERSTFDLYQQRMNQMDIFGFTPGTSTIIHDSLSQTSRFFTFERGVFYNEGPMAFFPGTKDKFIFTGNYFTDTDELKGSKLYTSDRINTLKLFIASWSLQDSTWQVEPLMFEGNHAELFNSELYSVAHPTFNKNGTELYFSSNVPMPGSGNKMGNYGNSDIYKSTFDPNTGKLGVPENLGSAINSEGNELFPFVFTTETGEETLYFSSNFHEDDGLGQLDIYYSGFCNGSFANRANIGAPINSIKDDFGLILNKSGTAGYLSSDRDGSDDIYKFRELQVLITVMEKGSSEKIISDARIDLIPEQGQLISGTISIGGTNRYRSFDLNSRYIVQVKPNSEVLFPNSKTFTTELSAFDAYGILRDTIFLERKPEVKMLVLANVKSWQQIFVAFSKNTGGLTTEDSIRGSENYELLYELGYDAEKGQNYLQNTINGELKYLSASQIVTIDRMEAVNKQRYLKEFFIKNNILVPDSVISYGQVASNPVVIRNIRYGFDSPNFSANDAEKIDPDAQFKKMAAVLRDYPHLKTKMSSHTDECPLPPYYYDNMGLSKRRNNTAVEGLLKYYSELDTAIRLVKCEYDGSYPVDQSSENYKENGKGQNCANQYNRRTEFKLLYNQRRLYAEDCDCENEAMILAPKPENISSTLNFQPTQGGR